MLNNIPPKTLSVFFKFFFVALSLIMMCYNLYAVIIPSGRYFKGDAGPYLFVVGLSICVFIIAGLRIWYFPTSVIIDDQENVLYVKYIFIQSKTISKKDMASYKEVYAQSRVRRYDGIVLYLKDGKQVLFSELNLSDYLAVQNYLQEIKVHYDGEASFSFASYYLNQ